MAKLRLKLDFPIDVTALGRVVQPGELVDVPDALFALAIVHGPTGTVIGHDDGAAGVVWPDAVWSVVDEPAGRRSRIATDAEFAAALARGDLDLTPPPALLAPQEPDGDQPVEEDEPGEPAAAGDDEPKDGE